MSAMSQIANLLDELKRIHNGGAWHGPALREALAGVTAEQATMRPVPGAHSIWELVLHLAPEDSLELRVRGAGSDDDGIGRQFLLDGQCATVICFCLVQVSPHACYYSKPV